MAQLISTPLVLAFLGIVGSCASADIDKGAAAACQPGTLDADAISAMIDLSDRLHNGDATLVLPDDCVKTLPSGDTTVPNPFVLSIEAAAGSVTSADYRQAMGDLYGRTFAGDAISRAGTDSTIALYLRMACGVDQACVQAFANETPDFNAAQSPVFCDFAQTPDPDTVTAVTGPLVGNMPLACSGASSTGVSALSNDPRAHWMSAFEQLGDPS
jgi:hypothetical protein